jgi:PAS domain S-box-containing protein
VELLVWLLTDAAGDVMACGPESARLLGVDPRGSSLAELFGAEAARRLLSGPEESFEWPRATSRAGAEPVAWRAERHRLEGGGLLVRAGPLRGSREEVPAAWERRITRQLLDPHAEILEHQRAFMLSVLDADPSCIYVKDRHGRFVFVNKAVADLFDTTPDELVLKAVDQVHQDQDELKAFDEADRRAFNTRSEVRLDERITRSDGAVLWYDTRKRPLLAPDGDLFVLGISVDVTERRHIEQLLQEANRRLELAVSAGQLGLWDWDLVSNTVYFSPTWKAQLGYEDHELSNVAETWTSLMHPEDSVRVLEAVGRFVKEPASGARLLNEFRLRARDGSWRWIAGYGFVVRGAHGQAERVTGYHVDITAWKEREAAQELLRENLRRTNEHLERLARMKDEFIANMSHELRTPLNAVLGQAEAMEGGIFGPVTEAQRSALRTIEESGRHLLSLINDVLDISKSTVGRLELEPAEVSVEEVCQGSLRLVQEQARRKRISVAYTREEAAASVWADPRRLRQVLINLLSNAKKFTPEGGRIGLEVAARPGGAVAFTVWDTGPGIAEGDHQRIFEPFVQLDTGLGRRHDGSGLGLSLVRRLVDLHRGTLELQSEAGRGSRFTVVLPARR